MSFKIKPHSDSGDFGLTFGVDNQYDNRLGSGIVAFDLSNNKLVSFNNVSNIIRYGSELAHINYVFNADQQYQVDVIVAGEVISVYLNNEIALTSRLMDMEGYSFGFYSNKARAEIKEVTFYE